MTAAQALWLGLGLAVLALVAVAWLKGAFGLATALSRKFAHEGGESWTLAALAEPFFAVVVVFAVSAFRPAHPQSWWARTFYGEDRMVRAEERHSDGPRPI